MKWTRNPLPAQCSERYKLAGGDWWLIENPRTEPGVAFALVGPSFQTLVLEAESLKAAKREARKRINRWTSWETELGNYLRV